MKTINFLQEIANYTHHNKTINKLIYQQSDSIRKAFFTNDSEALKNQISAIDRYANDCAVISCNSV